MKVLFLFLLLTVIPCFGAAQLWIDLEGGAITTGYNDVRITGSNGTLFSLPDDLGGQVQAYYRLRAGYRFHGRSEVFVLFAPLQIDYEGRFSNDVTFKEEVFPMGKQVDGTYRFNSYRATYRYHLRSAERFDAALGLTIKVRDAVIALDDGTRQSDRPDLGGVPLLHFFLHWKPSKRFGIMLEGDALAVRSGRAEDVMLALTYRPVRPLTLRAGYRLLEGGADNRKVYTFSMFHYGLLGLTINL